jgi:mRNA interferase MazF
MVIPYVSEAGDIVMMDFDPQVGREQAKRRPALVLTDQRYYRASGLAAVCPLTSNAGPTHSHCPL